MGASTGNMLVDDPNVLEGIFTHAPVPVAVHCEDTPTILRNEAEFRSRFGEDVPADCHPRIRSEEACYRSSALAVDLARKTGARLHLLHLTTARELDLLSESPLAEKTVTAEVCVHHLFFHDGDYADKGHLIKCNPSIKTRADREALRRALVDGRIDVIATDHAPHTLEEKRRPYFSSPSGLPLVQHSLPVLLELVDQGHLTLEQVVEMACHAPALRFEVRDRGFIREGYWADLVLVDLGAPTTVRRDGLLCRCGWSPFEGHTFPGRVDATFVSGRLAFEAGRPLPRPGGRRLAFDRR
jgi:dihydroorotase